MERQVPVSWRGFTQKLRPEQIATQQSWGVVPETDMIKAASHMIRVVPKGSTTVTEMFELDPGISGERAGEGRGWLAAPRAYAPVTHNGRVLA